MVKRRAVPGYVVKSLIWEKTWFFGCCWSCLDAGGWGSGGCAWRRKAAQAARWSAQCNPKLFSTQVFRASKLFDPTFLSQPTSLAFRFRSDYYLVIETNSFKIAWFYTAGPILLTTFSSAAIYLCKTFLIAIKSTLVWCYSSLTPLPPTRLCSNCKWGGCLFHCLHQPGEIWDFWVKFDFCPSRTGSVAWVSLTSPWEIALPGWLTGQHLFSFNTNCCSLEKQPNAGWFQRQRATWATVWVRGCLAQRVLQAQTDTLPAIVSD